MKRSLLIFLCIVSFFILAAGTRYAYWEYKNGTLFTDSNVSMPNTQVSTVVPLGAALSGTCTIDVGAYDWYYGTLAGDTTIEFTGWDDSGKGDWCMIELVNPGAHALTITGGAWPGGVQPEWTVAGRDVFTVRSRNNGLTVDCTIVGYDYAE